MNLFFVNTDKRRQSPAEWLTRGIAVTTDNDANRRALEKIGAGDGVLAYENLKGIVAFGRALAGEVLEIRDPERMVNGSERVEYHLPVCWEADLRNTPVSHTDVRRYAGVQPVHTCQQVKQGKDWILGRIRELSTGGALEARVAAAARELQEDLDILRSETGGDRTTREALVQARIGQGRFRVDLMNEFGGRCAVTGLSMSPVLRASHIKPWRESSDEQRLDPSNGLLLRADLDALFDVALITFDARNGELLVSSQVSREHRDALDLSHSLQAGLTAARSAYLKAHNEWFQQLEVEGR